MSMNDYVKNAYNSFLEKVNQWIYKKEIKKSRLADKVGISRQTLYDYLKGTVMMNGEVIIALKFLMEHPEEPI